MCAHTRVCVCVKEDCRQGEGGRDANWNSFSHVWHTHTRSCTRTLIFTPALALIKVGFAIWRPCARLASLCSSMCLCVRSKQGRLVPTHKQIQTKLWHMYESVRLIKINLWRLRSLTSARADMLWRMHTHRLFYLKKVARHPSNSGSWRGKLWAGKCGADVLFPISDYRRCALRRCSYSELCRDQRTVEVLENFQMCLTRR